MKVLRTTEQEVSAFNVGDVIEFTLNDGEQVQAMAVKQEGERTLFCLVDCLKDEETMRRLPDKLNTSILDRFPQEVRDKMVPFADGRKLRLPTEKEMFGKNEYGEDEGETVQQWAAMKNRRNRIAFQGKGGPLEWYWTETKYRVYDDYFAYVNSTGRADYSGAGNSIGVRPVFQF